VTICTCDNLSTLRITHVEIGTGSYQVAGFERSTTGWSAAGNPAGTEELPLFGSQDLSPPLLKVGNAGDDKSRRRAKGIREEVQSSSVFVCTRQPFGKRTFHFARLLRKTARWILIIDWRPVLLKEL
jgi:hypothetical protein